MLLARQCLYFGLFLNIPIVASQKTVRGHVKEQVFIPCGVGGSYTLPHWLKDGKGLTTQDLTGVNPAYPRISYDTDNKTLVVRSAELEDSGTYECTHTKGSHSPQKTIVIITEKPEDCSNPCRIVTAIYAFFVLAILVITAVIIYCCYILIWAYMEYKKMKVILEDNNATDVLVILIIAAVLFITISAWFIVLQATVEDCEEMTKKESNINIGLLVVEIFVFVGGVFAIRPAYICHKRMKMKIIRKIIRLKILQIITSAFPYDISREDLERILVGVERPIIKQQLEELQKENKIHLRTGGGYVRGNYILKTGQIMIGNCREKIFQILTHAYPDILIVEDLRTIMGVEADIIKQELEKLKNDSLIISRHDGFVVKDHGSKSELIRERILQFLGYAFPKALTTDDLCKIIAGVEDIGQHLNKLKEDRLISSTKGGFVFNPSETGNQRREEEVILLQMRD